MHFGRLASYPEHTVECLDDNAASEFVSGSLAKSALSRVEMHLAGCRDCRALVAALAGDEADSNAATHKHERIEDSQLAKLPVLSVGDRVNRYLVLSSLGAGGMGVVFAAYDPQLDRKVALKLLRANLGPSAKDARTRLKREAQAIAQLNHPNVVGVYDVGEHKDGDVYIAMEFVEGDTLTTWLRRWPRTWREILEVFEQAARGLMAAHSVGLLHRDFKPDNVLVGADGRVRVTDFGLARSLFLDDTSRGGTTVDGKRPRADTPLRVDLTATGTVLGTPRYMPPEQLMGPSIDARADQFSFCVALYEALYSVHPLPGATSVSMLEKDERAQAPPEGTKVPAAIGRAVMRGLEKDRSKRFPTLATLMHELKPPPQRSPVKFIAFAAIGALLVTAATAAVMTRPDQGTARPQSETDQMIEKLTKELKEKDKRIQALEDALIRDKSKSEEELHNLRAQLEDEHKKEDDLYRQIVALKTKAITGKPMSVVTRQITDSIQSVQHDVEGCFDEWAERAHLEQARGAGSPAPRDANLQVELSVTPDGVGHNVVAKNHDSPSMKTCIEDALGRVHYPKGPDVLTVHVDVAWSGGNLNMTGRIVNRTETKGSGAIDL